ncbi:MAG: 4'-phosphopantetheinyl transferase superfamily protein [Raineya sp.]|nr:4'-phosphopantetheinyl transferase superfamily protein [Raineya sp.]MDW8295383.1 4'-phosphopantetheinyl transferase superfamily protein [Raineya sp.]
MALFWQDHIAEHIRIFVWHIEETLTELTKSLLEQEKKELTQIRIAEKQLEYAAVRSLLRVVVQRENLEYSPIQKTELGKPFLPNAFWQISIAHSFPFVAIALHKEAIGIDIEQRKAKIQKVATRVFAEKELFWAKDNLYILTQLWTAKEAIYKAYSLKGLIFKENILCDFCTEKQNFCKGRIQKSNFKVEYCLEHYDIGKNHHLCVAFQ